MEYTAVSPNGLVDAGPTRPTRRLRLRLRLRTLAVMKTLYVRNVPDDELLWLKASAKVQGISEAEFVRKLVSNAYQEAIRAAEPPANRVKRFMGEK